MREATRRVDSIFLHRPWLMSFVSAATVVAPALLIAVWLDALESAWVVLLVIFLVWAIGGGIKRSRRAQHT
jgi:hypothetical protein